jgi:photosystem II stability/assembly factor-like uncharacterized protein
MNSIQWMMIKKIQRSLRGLTIGGLIMILFNKLSACISRISIFITIPVFLSTASVHAADWIHFKTIPSGTVPVHSAAGNIIIAGFSDRTHGIALGTPNEFLFTNDGGRTWQTSAVPNISYLNSIEMLDASNIWVSSGLDTRYSPNGGKSWKELPAFGSIYSSGHYLSFCDPLNGWYGICRGGTVQTLSQTTDGGINWIKVKTPAQANDRLWSIHLMSPEAGFLLLYDGSIYTTGNGGKRWTLKGKLPLKNRIVQDTTYGGQTNAAFRFTDTLNGIAVIYIMMPRGYCSFSTKDGGKTWAEDKLPDETRTFHGSVFLSRDAQYLTITDLENSSIIICRKK